MPPLKPPQRLKPSTPPPAKLPQSLPPPRPVPVAVAEPARLPSMPAPSVPAPSVPAPSPPPQSAPPPKAPAPKAPAPKAPTPVQPPAFADGANEDSAEYYVNVGEDVLTLKLTAIQAQLDLGKLGRDTLLCEVGASKWRTISEATELKLRLPDLSSSTNVLETDLIEEELATIDEDHAKAEPSTDAQPAPTSPKAPAESTRPEEPLLSASAETKRSPLPFKTKAKRAAWALLCAACLLAVAQRNGGLYSAAGWIGQAQNYEALEMDLIGGPGAGTVRDAELLWKRKVPKGTIPFGP